MSSEFLMKRVHKVVDHLQQPPATTLGHSLLRPRSTESDRAKKMVVCGGMSEPWSKKHKRDFKGCRFSLSNSFAQPLSQAELFRLTVDRGDHALIDAYNQHDLEYIPNGGSRDLREDIAELYGPNIGADNILVFAGGQVALQTAALAFARDCHSIVFTPGYQSTVESPQWASNSRVTAIEKQAASNWQIDIEKVKAAIREDTRFMVINEPYNPAGVVMSAKLQQQLKALAELNNIVILSDEVYRLLEHDPNDQIAAIADFYNKGISAVTMSKPWGACGVTIGWLACQDLQMKQKLVDVQYFGTACVSRASEIQAMMILRASDTILESRLQIIRHNLQLLTSFIEEQYKEFFEWKRPTAGAVCFVKFKGPWTSEQLGYELAKEDISIKPAYCFTDHVTPDKDYFRVGFGETKMPKALEAFSAFVEKHKSSWRKAMM